LGSNDPELNPATYYPSFIRAVKEVADCGIAAHSIHETGYQSQPTLKMAGAT